MLSCGRVNERLATLLRPLLAPRGAAWRTAVGLVSRCSARVNSDTWGRGSPCSRKATITRDGKGYCTQHDPEAQKARDKAWREKYEAEQQADEAIFQEGLALAARLKAGSVYCAALGSPTRYRHRRALVVPFEVLDALLKEVGR